MEIWNIYLIASQTTPSVVTKKNEYEQKVVVHPFILLTFYNWHRNCAKGADIITNRMHTRYL
jgi:hypothetical protein